MEDPLDEEEVEGFDSVEELVEDDPEDAVVVVELLELPLSELRLSVR